MKVEIGKKYKDRFNTVFTIISDQAKPPYKYVGQSITTGALIGFTYDGQSAHCSGGLVQEVQGDKMKVYAIHKAGRTVPLSELQLYTSKVKAEQRKSNEDSIVELDVDEYPTFSELNTWLHTLTTPENILDVMKALQRAEKYGLGWEVLYSAHERQDEPDFEIVDALQEACYRWDV